MRNEIQGDLTAIIQAISSNTKIEDIFLLRGMAIPAKIFDILKFTF